MPGDGGDRTPLPDAAEPFATMTREELLSEIDRYAKSYNRLDRKLDAYKRYVHMLENVEKAARALPFFQSYFVQSALTGLDAFRRSEDKRQERVRRRDEREDAEDEKRAKARGQGSPEHTKVCEERWGTRRECSCLDRRVRSVAPATPPRSEKPDR